MQKSRSILLQITHWLQKGLFRIIDNITFAHLFRLTILQHFRQVFIAVIRLHNFGSNLVQIAQFPQEIFFGKIECYYCLPTVFYQATTFQKSPQMANHETRLHNFGSKWAQVVLSTKREFFGKAAQYCFSVLYLIQCAI